MPRITLSNFRKGFVGNTGFESSDAGGALLTNFVIDRDGRLVARNGTARPGTYTPTGAQGSLATSLHRLTVQNANVSAASRVTHTVFSLVSATPVKFDTTPSAVQVKYSSGNVEFYRRVFEDSYMPAVLFKGRAFFGGSDRTSQVGANSVTPVMAWMDFSDTTGTTYTVGSDVPQISLADLAGGSLTVAKYYRVQATWYNSTYDIETNAVGATLLLTGNDASIRVTITKTTNSQYDNVRLYISAAQDTEAAGDAAATYLYATVAHTPGTGTMTSDITAVSTSGTEPPDDHDCLESPFSAKIGNCPVFLSAYNDVLWAGFWPNRVRFSKWTPTGIYPDAFPIENDFTVGSSGESITGMIASPNNALLIFTPDAMYTVRGNSINNLDRGQVNRTIGCGYPRSLAIVGNLVYFLGSDNRVWATDGTQMTPMSERIDHRLSHIEESWRWLPCGIGYGKFYYLSFPSSTPVVSSSTGTTIASATTTLFDKDSGHKVTDGSAWDLSGVRAGMWLHKNGDPAMSGMIVNVSDASDFVEVDGVRKTFTTGKYDVVANQRTVVYDTQYRYWTEFDKGANCWAWFNNDQGELYGALGTSDFIDQWDTGTTDTGSVAITATWRSGWIQIGNPQKIVAVRVYMESGTESSVTVNVYKDFLTTVDSTATVTPSRETGFRIGVFSVGHAHQIEVTGATIGKIERIEIEWEK